MTRPAGFVASSLAAALQALPPRELEVKMVSGSPRNSRTHLVFQDQADLQGQLGKTVDDGKLVVEGVRDASVVVRDEVCRKAVIINGRDLEVAVTSETMLRHGQDLSPGSKPLVQVAGPITSSCEGQ